MDITCNDVVFGEMTYKHRWIKAETITFWNKEYDITIAAKAYSGKPITDAQRESYSKFISSQETILSKAGNALMQFINDNGEELSSKWFGARMLNSVSELPEVVTPKTLLFKQDGTAIILLDCPWDVEHGFAIQIYPNLQLGSQDLFL